MNLCGQMISRSLAAQNLFFLLGSRGWSNEKEQWRDPASRCVGQPLLRALCCAVTSATVRLFPYMQQKPFLIHTSTPFLLP